MKFTTVCHTELSSPPYHAIATKYYNIPVFGPIVYGTMLGNMGGFILNGIDGYTHRHGIPYPFQNGNVFFQHLCTPLCVFLIEFLHVLTKYFALVFILVVPTIIGFVGFEQ
jgi:hypothetical protein